MKKFCLYVVFVLICALMTAPALAGEIVIYPDEFPPKTLQSVDVSYTTDVVAPSNTEPTNKSPSLTGNNVTINSGSVNCVIGAANLIFGDTDPITSNEVFIKGGTVNHQVYGGYGEDCDVVGNSVTISGGSGMNLGVMGGYSFNGKAMNNAVVVSGGSTDSGVSGGFSGGDATGNTVTISGGSVGGDAVGGLGFGGGATGNTVTISGGSLGSVIGGSGFGDATGNTVTISGGSVDGGWVVGGMCDGAGDATGNTVIIRGAPTFAPGCVIYGGDLRGGGNAFTGNTLQLGASIAVTNVANFENYEFNIPASIANGGTVITVDNPLDLANTNIDITGIGVGSSLRNGHTITLISNVAGSPSFINGVAYVPDTDIVTSHGTWQFSIVGGALTAKAVSLPSSGGGGGGGGCNAFGSLGILSLAGLIFTRRW